MNSPKNLITLITFIIITLFLSIFLSIRQIKIERELEINFTVHQVEITPALRAIFYDEKGRQLRLNRFVFFDSDKIQKGDVIVKKKGAEVLKVFRKDSLGNNVLYLEMHEH